MKRNIIQIDEDKCNGCTLCVSACHEGALKMVNGKATLITDSYCDGLGACLPDCPTGAITIIEREADAFDEEAVEARIAEAKTQPTNQRTAAGGGCPGSAARALPGANTSGCPGSRATALTKKASPTNVSPADRQESQLRQWPVQIKLVPVKAPYLNQAHLLIAADCTAFAYANIHEDFMKDRVTLIGCPKLDEGDYSDKLSEILTHNDIQSVTVLRMEVPCCGGIVQAVKNALIRSGSMIPWRVLTIGVEGDIREAM